MFKKGILFLGLFFGFSLQLSAQVDFSYPDNLPSGIELFGDLRQGGILYGKAPLKSEIKFNKVNIPVSPKGIFIIGLGREQTQDNWLSVISPEHQATKIALRVGARDWKLQKIDGLSPQMVSPDEQTLKRIEMENQQISKVREKITADVYCHNEFIMPLEGVISSPFGAQRILNGEMRAPHSGIDLKASAGTPVKASADGMVSLVHEDLYLTGKTVMINHGLGLSTIYVHLDKITAKLGKLVKQGEIIGMVGQTGRATGPHLHFGITVGTTKIDPESFLKLGLPDFIRN